MLIALALLMACHPKDPVEASNDTATTDTTDTTDTTGPTYYEDVKPILDGYCVNCHSDEATIAPVPLTNYASAATVKDRIVQTAVLLMIEPIFEADFLDCSFGFRPGKSAHQAIDVIRQHLQDGYRDVYDADLKGYFDTIPHDQLMKCLKMRITDRSVLELIRMWLESPVIERDDAGRTKGTRPKQGTPQGGVISPLLANIYLHWFEKAFHASDGPAHWAQAKIVRYADDCASGNVHAR